MGVLPRRNGDVPFSIPLRQFFKDNGASGHIDSQGESLSGENCFDETSLKEIFNCTFEAGKQTRMMSSNATFESKQPFTVTKDFKIFFYRQGAWSQGWLDKTKISPGVKLELENEQYGKITRVFYVPAGLL